MVDRVHPLKFESPSSGGSELDEFPTGLNKNEDYVDARGSTYQNATSDDENVRVERVGGDLTFRDVEIPGGKTLSQLAAGGNVVIVRDEGTGIENGPHSVLDFVGAGVTATDKGSGVAEINIPGGGEGAGGLIYPFGGKGAYSKFFGSHGVANGPVAASVDQFSEAIMLTDGTITAISWSTKLGDATTLWKVHVNSIVVDSIMLTGASGIIDTLSIPILKGDSLALEMDSGTLSNETTLRFLVT